MLSGNISCTELLTNYWKLRDCRYLVEWKWRKSNLSASGKGCFPTHNSNITNSGWLSIISTIIKYICIVIFQTKHNGMSCTKMIVASQARSMNQYKNLRSMVLKCCSNIYFNRQCFKTNITPNNANIKTPHTSPVSVITKQKIQ